MANILENQLDIETYKYKKSNNSLKTLDFFIGQDKNINGWMCEIEL